MHIAFIGTRGIPATYSGFETCVQEVAQRMVMRGHEVTVFCRRHHYHAHPPEWQGIRLRYLPSIQQKHLDTISHTALSAMTLPRGAAVVCMGVGNAPIVLALERVGRRTVFNVDGADWNRDKWGPNSRRYLQICERMAAQSKSILVADARTISAYYREDLGRNTECVPYGANPPGNFGCETLDRVGLTSRGYILFVGRLVPENGAHELVDAVRSSELTVPTAIVGDAPYSREYIHTLRAGAPENVIFPGYQFGAAYEQLSHHAGLFVLAAAVGGTHPVLIEQMAAGNCVLAKDVPANREVLGNAGLYWRSAGELASLLRRVWPDSRLKDALGRRSKRRAQTFYDWEAVTDRYLQLCERTLA